jgi:hypothetical protein
MDIYKILQRIPFDEFKIDKKGNVRIFRNHTLNVVVAQISRKRLKLWSYPRIICGLMALVALPFSLIVMLPVYLWRSALHQDELRKDILSALMPEGIDKLEFPKVKEAPVPEPEVI